MRSAKWRLPVARATSMWNWKSEGTASETSSMEASKAASAAAMFCRWLSSRRSAARLAASLSRLMRSSSSEITSATVAKSSGATRKLLCSGGAITKVPMPWRVSTWPDACRREMASRTTVRLTANRAISSDSVGNLSPVCRRPSRTSAVSVSTISGTRPRCRRGRGGGAASGIASSPRVFTGSIVFSLTRHCGVHTIRPSCLTTDNRQQDGRTVANPSRKSKPFETRPHTPWIRPSKPTTACC